MGWQPKEMDEYMVNNRDSMISTTGYADKVMQNYRQATTGDRSRSNTRGSRGSRSPGPRASAQVQVSRPSSMSRVSRQDSFMSRPGSRDSMLSIRGLPRIKAGSLVEKFKSIQNEKPQLTEEQEKELEDQNRKFSRRKGQLKQQQTNVFIKLNEVKKLMPRPEQTKQTAAAPAEALDDALRLLGELSKRVEQVYDMYTFYAARSLNARFAEEHCTKKISQMAQHTVLIKQVEDQIRLMIADASGEDAFSMAGLNEEKEDAGVGKEVEEGKKEAEDESDKEGDEEEEDEGEDDQGQVVGRKRNRKAKGKEQPKGRATTGRPLSADIEKHVAKHLHPKDAEAQVDPALPSSLISNAADAEDQAEELDQDDDDSQPDEWLDGFGIDADDVDDDETGFFRNDHGDIVEGPRRGVRRVPTQRSESSRDSRKDQRPSRARSTRYRRREQIEPTWTPSVSARSPSSKPIATSSEGSSKGAIPGHQPIKDVRSFGDSTSERDSVKRDPANTRDLSRGDEAAVPIYTQGKSYAQSETQSQGDLVMTFWDSDDDDVGKDVDHKPAQQHLIRNFEPVEIAQPGSAGSAASSTWDPRIEPRLPPKARLDGTTPSAGSAASINTTSSQFGVRGWLGALDEPDEGQLGAGLMAELGEVFGPHVDLADDEAWKDDDAAGEFAESSVPLSGAGSALPSSSPTWTKSHGSSSAYKNGVKSTDSNSPTKPVIPPVVDEELGLLSLLMGQIRPWWDLIHTLWVLAIVNPFCLNAALSLEVRAIIRWHVLGRESPWRAPLPSRAHLPLRSVLVIMVHCFMVLTVQVWIANTRERQIWQRANGETRAYLISRVYEDPSMRFLPGVDPKLMIGGPAGAAALMGAMHLVEEWVLPKAMEFYVDYMAAVLPIFFFG